MRFSWTPQAVEVLRAIYPQEGPFAVMERLGTGYHSVTNKAKRLGLRYRNRYRDAARTRSRRSDAVNQTFFDEWSEDMAYLLGYIWADGCVRTTPRFTLKFGCAIEDELFLRKIRDTLQAKRNFWRKKGKIWNGYQCQDTVGFEVNCEYLVRELVEEHGLCPRKSFVDPPYPFVPDSLFSHFLRGNFDGDGTICRSGRLTLFSLCGSNRFVIGIRDQAVRVLGVAYHPVYVPSRPPVRVQWTSKKDLATFYRVLYPESVSLFLPRKYDKFRQFLGREGKESEESSLTFSQVA